MECWSVGVLGSIHSHRASQCPSFSNTPLLHFFTGVAHFGVLEYWSVGVTTTHTRLPNTPILHFSISLPECWSVGVLGNHPYPAFPILHRSITPFLYRSGTPWSAGVLECWVTTHIRRSHYSITPCFFTFAQRWKSVATGFRRSQISKRPRPKDAALSSP
jgi:hypothetical protein